MEEERSKVTEVQGLSHSLTPLAGAHSHKCPHFLFKDHKHPSCEIKFVSSNFGFYSVYKCFVLGWTETQSF